jgi:hypothetical protein
LIALSFRCISYLSIYHFYIDFIPHLVQISKNYLLILFPFFFVSFISSASSAFSFSSRSPPASSSFTRIRHKNFYLYIKIHIESYSRDDLPFTNSDTDCEYSVPTEFSATHSYLPSSLPILLVICNAPE